MFSKGQVISINVLGVFLLLAIGFLVHSNYKNGSAAYDRNLILVEQNELLREQNIILSKGTRCLGQELMNRNIELERLHAKSPEHH